MDIVRVKDLHVGYGRRVVLRDVNFAIARSDITAIVGESGSGKSSLLKTLIGLVPPVSGEIFIAGEALDCYSEKHLWSVYRKIGVLYQNDALLGSMTLFENVALPIRIHSPKVNRAEEKERVEAILSRVGLHGHSHVYPYELSGGMRKRGALARAMIMDPEIVFCDEPSAGLDPITAAGLDRLLLDLKSKHGMTFVVVTHELRSISAIADRVIVLKDGAVLAHGSLREVLDFPHQYIHDFFLREEDHVH